MATTVKVLLPELLLHCTQGEKCVEIEAETIQGVIDNLIGRFPLLKTHLFNEQGQRREHVLFYFNEENIDWLDSMDKSVRQEDRFTILQAVTGG